VQAKYYLMGLREQSRRMGVTAQKASSAFSAWLKAAHSIYFGLRKQSFQAEIHTAIYLKIPCRQPIVCIGGIFSAKNGSVNSFV
jgi:hypothetical protein